jgi:hypothetical protein
VLPAALPVPGQQQPQAAAAAAAAAAAVAAVATLGRKRRRPGEELALMDAQRGGAGAVAGSAAGSGQSDAVAAEYATEMLQIMRRLRERCVSWGAVSGA